MAMLLSCVVLFAFGSMLVQPPLQTFMAGLANPSALGSYFGFGALALALGGGAGNFLGGWLYDTARANNLPALPWLVFAAIGFAVAGGLLIFDRVYTQARTPKTTFQPATKS
jgi:DHA1 family multidrug resistance protein-like MFS transporter